MDILAALNHEGKPLVTVAHEPLIARRYRHIVYLRNSGITAQARIRL